MTKKPPKRPWLVQLLDLRQTIEARTRGSAIRKAVRQWIAAGELKRQPRTVAGEFAGVTAAPIAVSP